MEKIPLKGQYTESLILIGERLENLHAYIPKQKVFVITDQHVHHIYGHMWKDFPTYLLAPGESSKVLELAGSIYRWLISNDADRSAFIVAVGGGMVCDLAGFVASTFMRGLNFGFVASSLLAQVDASVGGKNGVNIDGYKNIVGTFNQPGFVICDTNMLKSLPITELQNGLAEVVKHALITDHEMFARIQNNISAIFALQPDIINYLVSRSVHIKSQIVAQDERETGERRKLNLGHTWGHAVEKTDRIPHGHAVSIGLVFAADLSVSKGYLTIQERNSLVQLLQALGLPTATQTPVETVFQALLKDKKKEAGNMHFVLMKGIGHVVVEPIPINTLYDFVHGTPHSNT
jgi:3-dehydroquinate synthase